MIEPLLLQKEYEWFLKDFEIKPKVKKLRLTWGCVDTWKTNPYVITEMTSLPDNGTPGRRQKVLMMKIAGIPSNGKFPNPLDFFQLGMRMFAQVQLRWVENTADDTTYEFVYDTIRGKRTETQKASDADIKKVMFRVGQSKTLQEARSKVAAYDANLIPILDELVKSGKVNLP